MHVMNIFHSDLNKSVNVTPHTLYIYFNPFERVCKVCILTIVDTVTITGKLENTWTTMHDLLFSLLFFAGEYIVWVFFSQIILYVQLERIQQIWVFLQIIFCIFECQGSTKLEKMCILKIKCNKLALTFQVFCCHQVNFYACNMLSGKVNFLTWFLYAAKYLLSSKCIG